MPEDVHFFQGTTKESLARRLQWHIIAVILFSSLFVCFDAYYFLHLLCLPFLCCQAAQLTHVLNRRLTELIEDVERENASKDVAEDTAKEKGKAIVVAEKMAQSI